MEVILHIGAHRTGTTSLQRAVQRNRKKLADNGVAFWGAQITRGGRFSGLLRANDATDAETRRLIARNQGVVAVELDRLRQKGIRQVIVSEENILGTMRNNLRTSLLYPGLAQRLARFADVFGDDLSRVALAIRPYQDYWASALAFTIPSGQPAPAALDLDRLVRQPRTWRRVIDETAKAFCGVEIAVWDFDRMIGKPQAQYRILTGGTGRIAPFCERHNASAPREELREILRARGQNDAAAAIAPGQGRYMPFAAAQIADLTAIYQRDLSWLRDKTAQKVSFNDMADAQPALAQRYAVRGRI